MIFYFEKGERDLYFIVSFLNVTSPKNMLQGMPLPHGIT
jgi:hypothetical protein